MTIQFNLKDDRSETVHYEERLFRCRRERGFLSMPDSFTLAFHSRKNAAFLKPTERDRRQEDLHLSGRSFLKWCHRIKFTVPCLPETLPF